MKSGKCPKCRSENIFCSPPRTNFDMGHGNFIYIKSGFLKQINAKLIHYVCDDCQYTESYIDDDESMKNIRKEWIPMNSRKAKRKNDEA